MPVTALAEEAFETIKRLGGSNWVKREPARCRSTSRSLYSIFFSNASKQAAKHDGFMMDIDTQHPSNPLITDPFLVSILQTTYSARDAALHLLSVTSNPSLAPPTDDTTTPPPTDISHALAITRAQKPLFAHLALLRGQNRKLAHRLRDTKTVTSTSRSEVDTLHLSLQNLYYENRHLAGEIAAAEGYPHKYRNLPLVPEDEFLDAHPEWKERKRRREMAEMGMSDVIVDEVETTTQAHPLMQKMGHWRPQPDSAPNSPREPFAYRPPGIAKDDIYSHNRDRSGSPSTESVGSGLTPAPGNHGHAPAIVVEQQEWNEEEFMKARIEAEYQERVQLDEQRKRLLARKVELVKENAKRKEELGKLDKELEAFIEAAKPIQKTFEKDL